MRVKVLNKRPASVLQKKRVCDYARVSTDSRRQEDSLENQMETYERLITGNPEYGSEIKLQNFLIRCGF